MVSLITPVVEKPKERPKPPPVKTKVEKPMPPQPLPLLTAVTEAPTAPVTQPPPLPPPPAPVEVAAPKPVLAQAPVPVLPVIPPNFNADYLDNPPPAYPAESRRLREEGRVILRVLVNVVIPRNLSAEQRQQLERFAETLTPHNLEDEGERESLFHRVRRAFG